MKKAITPLKSVPAAFQDIGEKVNELIGSSLPIKAGTGIKIIETEKDTTISSTINETTLADSVASILTNSRTFFTYGNESADIIVTAGAINNVVYAGGTLTTPANGDKVYIDATISGTTVTAVTVSKAASVPADTTTHVYTLLATVAVAGSPSVATPTPVAWNYSQMQICGGQALWGGFGA